MRLSIIVPCKNEAENISELHKKISDSLDKLKYEIIYIDDGSIDNTLSNLKKIYEQDMKHTKILSFSRNFNKDSAILAGIKNSTGLYTCIMDSNLKHNPEYILDMYNYLEENEDCDIVAIKRNIEDCKIMRFTNNLIYKYCNIDMMKVFSEYRMFRTNVKGALISLSEKDRFTKGLFSWIGFNYKNIEVNKDSACEKISYKNYYKYTIEAIKSFSKKPFDLAYKLGVFTIILAVLYLIILFIQIFGFGIEMNAVYALIIIVMILFGIQFILISLVGNYLSLINSEVKNRPSYIIKEKIGFDNETIL